MKILVLNHDLKESTVIQQVVQQDGHEIIHAETSDAAMQLLQEGEIRFIIADRVTTDMVEKQFIQRVRNAQPPFYIYILLLVPEVQESDITTPRAGADDSLHKPIIPLELKSRIRIGERILSLDEDLVQARHTLQDSALFDPLVNLLNYKAFLALSRGELERARRGQSPLSLIALDIDNFQSIHDQFGQAVGYDILTVVAQGIREKSRPYDSVGRYEADTFLIILPGVIGQDAEKIAERILNGILNTDISLLDGTQLNVKLSAGIACSTHITASTEVDFLIEKAVEAMKQAKRDATSQAVMVFV
jgi:two-component system chemotaxis response regulator CheY